MFVPPTPIRPFNSPDRATRPSALTTEALTGGATLSHNDTVVDVRSFGGKTPVPHRFKGTDEEKIKVWQWLMGVDDYFALEHKNRSDADLVRLFGLLLEDSAQTWFRMKQRLEGAGLTLQRVYDSFLVQYAGAASDVLLQSRLEDLHFSRKKDFTTFSSQWQDLIAQLFPMEWTAGQGRDSLLLGSLFADVIKKDDVRVWAKAMDSQP
jgi:hypothetical protein